MAIKLSANYSKKLGLPEYSSHSFSASVEVELTDLSQVQAECQKLYALLQHSVDQEIQQVGFVPTPGYGSNGSRNGNGHASNGNGRTYQVNGNGRQYNGSNGIPLFTLSKFPLLYWDCMCEAFKDYASSNHLFTASGLNRTR